MFPAHPSRIIRFVFGTSVGKAFYRPWMQHSLNTEMCCQSSRQVNYDSAASNLITKRSTPAGFASSQFFTCRSPRAASLTHIQVFIRVNRCQRCACDLTYKLISHILCSYHLFQNGTIIKNVAIQTRSTYKYCVIKSERTLCIIQRDDSAISATSPCS